MQQASYNNKRLGRRVDSLRDQVVKNMKRFSKQTLERFIKAEDRIKKLENKLGAAQGLVQMSTSTVGNKRRRTGGRKSRRKTRRKSRKRRRKKRRRKTKRKR